MAGQGMARAWQGGSHEPSSSTTLPYPTQPSPTRYPTLAPLDKAGRGGINSEVLARNKGEVGKYGFFVFCLSGSISLVHHDNVAKEKKKTMCKITETSLALA